jgi:hypothetical protein
MSGAGAREAWLRLPDDALARECEIERIRGSGAGGQKRNKTSSLVRLRHRPTGLVAKAGESRSQHENKVRALRRLRERIAFELREPVELDGLYEPPPELAELLRPGAPGLGKKRRHTPEYLMGAAALLDLFAQTGASLAQTARLLGVPTGAVTRILRRDHRLARKVAELRKSRGDPPVAPTR